MKDHNATGSQKLIPVPFRDATLYVADIDGQPFTPMKPIVEGMGLAWEVQYRKLKSQEKRFSITEMVMQVPGDTQRRSAICMPLRKLPGWLMTIHPNKVKPEIRDTIIAYQNECDDVLWKHWSQGKTAVQDATLASQPRLYFAATRIARNLEFARSIGGRSAMYEQLRSVHQQLGLPPLMPLAMFGKPADQTDQMTMEV